MAGMSCMAGGVVHGGGHASHTVNEQVVHILLECILVKVCNENGL